MFNLTLNEKIQAFLKTCRAPDMLARYRGRDDFPAQIYMHAVKVTLPDLRGDFTSAVNREHEFSQPAKRLELRHGLSGIARDYKLPKGLSAIDLQIFCMLDSALRMDENAPVIKRPDPVALLAKIIVMNEDLQTLQFDRVDRRMVYHVLLGVASGFNPTDIKHFIDGNNGVVSRAMPGYQDKRDLIERSLGQYAVCWVPAPATLDKIIAQLPKNQPK